MKRFTKFTSLVLAFALLCTLLAPVNVTKAEAANISKTLYMALGEKLNISENNVVSVSSSKPANVKAVKSGSDKVVVTAKKAGSSKVVIKSRNKTIKLSIVVEKKTYSKSSSFHSSTVGTLTTTGPCYYGRVNIKNTTKHLYYDRVKVTYKCSLSNGEVDTYSAYIYDLAPNQSGSKLEDLSYGGVSVKSFTITAVSVSVSSCRYVHTNQSAKVKVSTPKKSGSYVIFSITNKSGKSVSGPIELASYDANGKVVDIRYIPISLKKGEATACKIYLDPFTSIYIAKKFKVLTKRFSSREYISF